MGLSTGLFLSFSSSSSLTLRLLYCPGMDPLDLEVAKESGSTEEERVHASAVWGVVARHHWLLCTLLLMNAAANEALPLCLNKVAPPAAVVVISVTLVLVFGEILPTAVFTGPGRLRLAAKMVPVVWALMWITAPVSWPVARGLDWLLGARKAEKRLNRRQIGTLIGLHLRARRVQPLRRALLAGYQDDLDSLGAGRRDGGLGGDSCRLDDRNSTPSVKGDDLGDPVVSARDTTPFLVPGRSSGTTKVDSSTCVGSGPAPSIGGRFFQRLFSSVSRGSTNVGEGDDVRRAESLTEDEVTIVRETLKLATKTVSDAMTPLAAVRMLSAEDTVFDDNTLADVLGLGHSRIPVYRCGNRHNITGVLMVKKLIVLSPSEKRPLRDMPLRGPLLVHPDAGLLETLNLFQAGKSHLALVTRHGRMLARAWRAGVDVEPGRVEVLGIITVEDVLEELIGEEIYDEDDYFQMLAPLGLQSPTLPPPTHHDGHEGSSNGRTLSNGREWGAEVADVEAGSAHFDAEPFTRPAVLSAIRKFRLLGERRRGRRLQCGTSAESLLSIAAASNPTTY